MSAARSYCLAAGELVRLRHARGAEVTVLSGRLWITEESSNEDVWLGAGEHASLGRDGLAILEAVGHTQVEIQQ